MNHGESQRINSTWGLGESHTRRRAQIAALQLGLDLGMTLIDTAEMYGEGASEELIGEAIEGRRTEVFLVSKVYPHHPPREGDGGICHSRQKRRCEFGGARSSMRRRVTSKVRQEQG